MDVNTEVEKPTQIAAPGWGAIAKRIGKSFVADRCTIAVLPGDHPQVRRSRRPLRQQRHDVRERGPPVPRETKRETKCGL